MHIIKGHHREESGSLAVGTLMIDKVDGRFYSTESGARLEAHRYAVTGEIEGVEITSPDSPVEFLPDSGELERIGMPIA